jgi:GNAT superfamily N-acetyltransferase
MKSSLQLRPWRSSDAARLAQLGERVVAETLRSRFWGGVAAVPATYLSSIAQRWPLDWDAVVALRDGELVGWAEFGRNAVGSAEADIAVCVIDSEQGHGTGTALLRALLVQASSAGLSTIHADISGTNTPALRTWLRATRALPVTLALADGSLRATATVPVALRQAA